MNADQIVMALRDYARAYNAGTPYDFSPAIAIQAGNEINHLKAEIFGQADLIKSLQAQLSASQRREKAAEQWATEFYAMLNRRRLLGFTDNSENARMDLYDDWRGPQGAGEGERNE